MIGRGEGGAMMRLSEKDGEPKEKNWVLKYPGKRSLARRMVARIWEIIGRRKMRLLGSRSGQTGAALLAPSKVESTR